MRPAARAANAVITKQAREIEELRRARRRKTSPELTRVKRRAKVARLSRSAYEDSIRAAVEAGCSKTAVAEAAGISRPTLYALLRKEGE